MCFIPCVRFANAVYHRGYDVREPVEVRISKDELVVLSYPGPDRSVRLDDLRAGRALPRRYRNRRIGEFLKELDMTEGRSTGIPKILHAMQANGSPPPVFDFDDDHSYFMCRLPVHPQATMPEALITETGLVDGLVDGLVESQKQIVKLVFQNPRITVKEMASVIGISSTAVGKNIDTLKAKGLLKRVGPAKSGHWEVMQRSASE